MWTYFVSVNIYGMQILSHASRICRDKPAYLYSLISTIGIREQFGFGNGPKDILVQGSKVLYLSIKNLTYEQNRHKHILGVCL